MSTDSQNPSLGEAATRFLASLPHEASGISQQAVYHFVRWYGWEQAPSELTAPAVASYAERLSSSDTDHIRKLELIQAFLVYARKERWTTTNLAAHLKVRKGKARPQPSTHPAETVPLTQQGYAALQTELAELKSKRSESIDEIRRAAADKDFRENAPLQAAREQRSHLEGQIKELEEVLKSAVIINEKPKDILKVSIGDSITLRDLASGEELRYIMVNPKEVDLTQGKISSASPIGKAVIGRGQGETVDVTAPVGKLRYQIEQIGR